MFLLEKENRILSLRDNFGNNSYQFSVKEADICIKKPAFYILYTFLRLPDFKGATFSENCELITKNFN